MLEPTRDRIAILLKANGDFVETLGECVRLVEFLYRDTPWVSQALDALADYWTGKASHSTRSHIRASIDKCLGNKPVEKPVNDEERRRFLSLLGRLSEMVNCRLVDNVLLNKLFTELPDSEIPQLTDEESKRARILYYELYPTEEREIRRQTQTHVTFSSGSMFDFSEGLQEDDGDGDDEDDFEDEDYDEEFEVDESGDVKNVLHVPDFTVSKRPTVEEQDAGREGDNNQDNHESESEVEEIGVKSVERSDEKRGYQHWLDED